MTVITTSAITLLRDIGKALDAIREIHQEATYAGRFNYRIASLSHKAEKALLNHHAHLVEAAHREKQHAVRYLPNLPDRLLCIAGRFQALEHQDTLERAMRLDGEFASYQDIADDLREAARIIAP